MKISKSNIVRNVNIKNHKVQSSKYKDSVKANEQSINTNNKNIEYNKHFINKSKKKKTNNIIKLNNNNHNNKNIKTNNIEVNLDSQDNIINPNNSDKNTKMNNIEMKLESQGNITTSKNNDKNIKMDNMEANRQSINNNNEKINISKQSIDNIRNIKTDIIDTDFKTNFNSIGINNQSIKTNKCVKTNKHSINDSVRDVNKNNVNKNNVMDMSIKNITQKDYNVNHEMIRHIAFIMDGNSTWAKIKNKPILDGYLAGMKKLANIILYINSLNIPYVTCYAFSSENWLRPKDWVDGFMDLVIKTLENDNKLIKTLLDAKIKLKVIGNKSKLPIKLQNIINYYENITKDNEGTLMQLAMSYGGRDEIVRAVTKLIENQMEINEENITQYLDTNGIPDPDLIIRTSSKKRLSNFLLWQASYSEFYSSDLLWPDFNKDELHKALSEFNNRVRTFIIYY